MRALRVGLTGGIGSGKSEALREFARAGLWTLSIDAIARRQAASRRMAVRLERAFGTSDRARLAAVVFADPAKRRKLERLTHPPILREMRRRLSWARGAAVVDVPLLFEAGVRREFDVVMTISAGASTRARRVARRDAAAASAVRRRMAAQWTDAQRERRADIVVRNDGARADFSRVIRGYAAGLRLLTQSAQAAL